MPDRTFALAPAFVVRQAGAPIELVARLATPGSSSLARDAIRLESEAKSLGAKVLDELVVLDPPRTLLTKAVKQLRAMKAAPPNTPPTPSLAAYDQARAAHQKALEALALAIGEDDDRTRRDLRVMARETLVRFAPFASALGAEERLGHLSDELPPANHKERQKERHWLMYAQRLATKNDTMSEFGPTSWGRVEDGVRGMTMAPNGISRREVFVEKWVALAVAERLNKDPEVRPELSPRLHPAGRLEDGRFVREDDGREIALDAGELALLAKCDGKTPARVLGLEAVAALEQKGVLRWEVEIVALDAHRFDPLVEAVRTWTGPARARWLPVVDELKSLEQKFGEGPTPGDRIATMARARDILVSIDAYHPKEGRSLYRAENALGEDCLKDAGFRLGRDVATRLTTEAAPWFNLWLDVYAFACSRQLEALRALFESAPRRGGRTRLAAFARHCEQKGAPITSNAMQGPLRLAFQEVKAAFREVVAGRTSAEELRLTAEDCAFVRRRFKFESFEPFTWPSADLQIAAESVAAVARGEYKLIVAELHGGGPPLLGHCYFWHCPWREDLARALRASSGGLPLMHYGFGAVDMTNHNTRHYAEVMPNWSFVANERVTDAWKPVTVSPGDAEVFVAPDGDVRVRAPDGRDLGSLAKNWHAWLAFHPFSFDIAPHCPRLLVGDVVVQRRTWTAEAPELPENSSDAEAMIAVARLRAALGLPRHVFVKPTGASVERGLALERDKDLKPIYIDLESLPFVRIIARWFGRYRFLEIAEMLPAPGEIPWDEATGHYAYELRSMIVAGA